jgi:hypothetical protein
LAAGSIGIVDDRQRHLSLAPDRRRRSVTRTATAIGDPMPEHDSERPRQFASPPCYAHEFGASEATRLTAAEVAARLNDLLEGERAGARGLLDMQAGHDAALARLLDEVARDEARFCAMLARHVSRLGHTPSRQTGAFYARLTAKPTLQDKLRLLDRGQSAVVRLLDELLPSVEDAALRDDLLEMRDTHVRNIERCAAFLDAGPI